MLAEELLKKVLSTPPIDPFYHRLPPITLEMCQREVSRGKKITYFYGRNLTDL